MDAKNKRNFILLGHAQSGKTTLAESLLYFCKATNRKGRIEDGSTISDYSFDEIERKNSINLSLLFCDYQGNRIQIIDTPGYADFSGEVISGLRAVDSAIIVLDAVSGVQVGTEHSWEALEEAGLPCMIFINKTDKEGVDINAALADIKSRLSKNCVIIESLEDPLLMEAIAESDDRLLEKYLSVLRLSVDEIKAGLAEAVHKRKLFPVVCGSALTDKGIKDLLDDIIQYVPCP
ncbi:MAG: GTP-binding protein, partial [Candidatus Omnitrophota bacterium]|nr:GTP-binding protein [Candidatus Omnitrophota bacterium]